MIGYAVSIVRSRLAISSIEEESSSKILLPSELSDKKLLPFQAGGIQIDSARHANQLLIFALHELESNIDSDVDLGRQLYVRSLTQLLRSLPTNLTSAELAELNNALPSEIVIDGSFAAAKEHRSQIEESIVQAIRNMAIALKVILPVAIILFRKVASKERQFKLSERSYAFSCGLVDRIFKSASSSRALGFGIDVVGAVTRGVAEGITILADTRKV
ncbi:uncharacterized protein V1516DRAFT_681528 [Lipomyces oligophaga]|uniref:uncharacterized protein n=1 Tax=Lipomyces oligophaga TaxID=45792 RepID=UPI0034CD8048